MWVVSIFQPITLRISKNGEPIVIVYTKLFYYFMRYASLIRKHCFSYCSAHLVNRAMLRVGFEQSAIQFKYNGKAYRVSRKKKILYLNFHYPTFKYLIWSNITLKHKKKRKKVFKLITNTLTSQTSNLFANLFKLRPLNTYTKRGIYMSNFAFLQRKPKSTSKR